MGGGERHGDGGRRLKCEGRQATDYVWRQKRKKKEKKDFTANGGFSVDMKNSRAER